MVNKFVVWCKNEKGILDSPSYNENSNVEYFTTVADARSRVKELDEMFNVPGNSYTTYTVMKLTPIK